MFIASLQTLRDQVGRHGVARARYVGQTSAQQTLRLPRSIRFFSPTATPARIAPIARSSRNCSVKRVRCRSRDNDGASWNLSQGSGINSGVDHQTIGGGPYAKNPDGTLKGGAIQLPA